MPLISTLGTKLGIDILKWLGSKGYHYISKSDFNDYEKELQRIIDASTEAYIQKYGSESKLGKTHFCGSEIVISELLKFRLSKNPNVDELSKVIQSDARIEIPTENELLNFLEIFSDLVKKSPTLHNLDISNNYKEEIYNIHEQLNEVMGAILDLKKEGSLVLIEEWSKWLDEVTENIELFKPKTALNILEKLESRINEKGININNELKGKIIYLKAICLSEVHFGEINKKDAELFIKAYNYCPERIEFKSNAGLSYFILGDILKANKIADEILKQDEYHSAAWAIRVFLSDSSFRSFLNEVPVHVKSKRNFKAQVGYWLITNGFINTIKELEAIGLDFEIRNENEPEIIDHKNCWYWRIVIRYLVSKLYDLNPLLNTSGFDAKIIDSVYFRYTHNLLKKLVKAIEGSEVEENYSWYTFQSLYMDNILIRDMHSLCKYPQNPDSLKVEKLTLNLNCNEKKQIHGNANYHDAQGA